MRDGHKVVGWAGLALFAALGESKRRRAFWAESLMTTKLSPVEPS
jgi:hypothetical protein